MSRSLDEVIAGFKAMSATLGMTPTGSAISMPTPSATMAAVTMPAMMPTPPPPPPPSAAAAAIASGSYLPPYDYTPQANTRQSFQVANAMGMGPSPMQMTSPEYGGFRPRPAFPNVSQGFLPPPSYPFPLAPATPTFTAPGEFAAQFSMMAQRQAEMHHMAMVSGGARFGMGMAGGLGLGSLGMLYGGQLAGGAGMRIGGIAGGLLGFGMGAFGPGASLSNAITSPAMHMSLNTMQLQEASSRFFTGAPGVGGAGAGFGAADASRVARELSRFADSSRGLFNRRDMMSITQSAGDTGLLDFANNADAIIRQVKTVARVAAAMAQITSDPDIQNNIRLLGQLQRMGSTPIESLQMLGGLRSSARMAGVSVGGYMSNEGMAGAAMYQGAGLLGSAGAGAMLYGAGMARNGMANGAFSPTLAGLLGGSSGIAQNFASSGAAFAAGPMQTILASVLSRGANGGLSLNQGAIDKLLSGQLDWNTTMGNAAMNLSDPRAIANFQVHGKELTADLMKRLSPEQMAMLQINAIRGTQNALGGPGMLSFGGAAMNLGMDANQAAMLEGVAGNEGYWINGRRQAMIDARQDSMARGRAYLAGPSAIRSRLGEAWDSVQHLNPFGGVDGYERQAEQDDAVYSSMGLDRVRARSIDEGSQDWWKRRAGRTRRRRSAFGSRSRNMATNRFRDWWDDTREATGMFNETDYAIERAAGGARQLAESVGDILPYFTGGVPVYGAAMGLTGMIGMDASGRGERARSRAGEVARAGASAGVIERGLGMTLQESGDIYGRASKSLGSHTSDVLGAMRLAATDATGNLVTGGDALGYRQNLVNAGRAAAAKAGIRVSDSELDEYAARVTADTSKNASNRRELQDMGGRLNNVGAAAGKSALKKRMRSADDVLEGAVQTYFDRSILNPRTWLSGQKDMAAVLGNVVKAAEELVGEDKAPELIRALVIDVKANDINDRGAQQRLYREDVQKYAKQIARMRSELEGTPAWEALKQVAAQFDTSSDTAMKRSTKALAGLTDELAAGHQQKADESILQGVGNRFGVKGLEGKSFDDALGTLVASGKLDRSLVGLANEYTKAQGPAKDAARSKLMKAMGRFDDGSGGAVQSKDGAKYGTGLTPEAARTQQSFDNFMSQNAAVFAAAGDKLLTGTEAFATFMSNLANGADHKILQAVAASVNHQNLQEPR